MLKISRRQFLEDAVLLAAAAAVPAPLYAAARGRKVGPNDKIRGSTGGG